MNPGPRPNRLMLVSSSQRNSSWADLWVTVGPAGADLGATLGRPWGDSVATLGDLEAGGRVRDGRRLTF